MAPKRTKELPPVALLRERLRYDAETGKLYWRENKGMPQCWRAKFAGREAFTTRSENMRNASMRINNTSGRVGVSRRPDGRWVAQIKRDGSSYLGIFSDKSEAIRARELAEAEFGYSARHGGRNEP